MEEGWIAPRESCPPQLVGPGQVPQTQKDMALPRFSLHLFAFKALRGPSVPLPPLAWQWGQAWLAREESSRAAPPMPPGLSGSQAKPFRQSLPGASLCSCRSGVSMVEVSRGGRDRDPEGLAGLSLSGCSQTHPHHQHGSLRSATDSTARRGEREQGEQGAKLAPPDSPPGPPPTWQVL